MNYDQARNSDYVSDNLLDHDWLISWRDEINQALGPFLTGFEATFGYPPGPNLVTDPSGEPPIGNHPELPKPLASLYEAVHEVSLPDIGNGYFIHAASHVLYELGDQGRINMTGAPGVVFASDGGGILYAITDSGSVHRSQAASRDSDFDLAADSLAEFLTQLRHAVLTFIRTGEPRRL